MAEKKYVGPSSLTELISSIKKGFAKIGHTHTKSEITDLTVDSSLSSTSTNPIQNKVVNSALSGKVPTSRTVNGKALSTNITLSASDVGADASGSADDALTEAKAYTESQVASTKSGLIGDATLKTLGALEDEIETKANADELSSHTGNSDIHFTAAERTKLSGIASGAQKNTITGVKGNSESSYRTGNINLTAANVGADPSGTASSVVSSHNTNTSAHTDIRNLITTLTTKVNNFLDVDDATIDQLSEVIALITENQDLIEGITTSKVNVSDIINNLTTNSSNRPLSAAQGVAIKALIDALQTAVNGKAASSHSHTITASASDDDVVVLTGTNGTNKVTYSASHANSGVTAGTYKSVTVNAKGHVTAGSNPTTLAGYGITDAASASDLDALSDVVDGKANTSHTHTIANVSGLQSTLDGKAASSHGNHVPATETANNAKFLRNDNTWQTVTPANIGAAATSHGTHVILMVHTGNLRMERSFVANR